MSEKGLTDSQRHERWLEDIEARLRFLEMLHTPPFSFEGQYKREDMVETRPRTRVNRVRDENFN